MERQFICTSCRRLLFAPSPRHRMPPNLLARHVRLSSTRAPRTIQVNPLGGYYESILSYPLAKTAPIPGAAAPPLTAKEEIAAKASIVFGSRLAGPAERRAEIDSKSTLVAGVWVPPRPGEPDNCCMSGCVNCVWDRYQDELEEWAAKKKEADRMLGNEKRKKGGFGGLSLGRDGERAGNAVLNMDEDGGGSESNWETGLDAGFGSEDLFKGVPVGIREFMKQEKRLREKHAREGTAG